MRLFLGIDAALRGFTILPEQIAGTCLIGVAFFVMIMPDNKLSIAIRKPKSSRTPPTMGQNPDESGSCSTSGSQAVLVLPTPSQVTVDALNVSEVVVPNPDDDAFDEDYTPEHKVKIEQGETRF